MATIKIKGLRSRTRASGTYYFWEPTPDERRANWSTISFGKDLAAAIAGSEARNLEIRLWQTGGARPAHVRAIVRRDTVAACARRYEEEHIANLRTEKARANAKSLLRHVVELFGDLDVDEVRAAHVHDWRDRMMGEGKWTGQKRLCSHHTAHNRLRSGRAFWNWMKAPARAITTVNPFENFELREPAPRNQLWERDDQGAFTAAAYALGLPSMALAIELAIYTAQRESDLIGMTEHQLTDQFAIHDARLSERFGGTDGRIVGWDVTQRKTLNAGIIPLEPQIREKVEAAIRTNRARDRAAGRIVTHVLIDDSTGKPWAVHRFIRAWQKIVDHAATQADRPNMRDLHWHDLKRTRVVRLKRLGLDRDAIAALTLTSPKSIDKMLSVYGPSDPTQTAYTLIAATDREAAATQARTA
jgi:hypothetical protein